MGLFKKRAQNPQQHIVEMVNTITDYTNTHQNRLDWLACSAGSPYTIFDELTHHLKVHQQLLTTKLVCETSCNHKKCDGNPQLAAQITGLPETNIKNYLRYSTLTTELVTELVEAAARTAEKIHTSPIPSVQYHTIVNTPQKGFGPEVALDPTPDPTTTQTLENTTSTPAQNPTRIATQAASRLAAIYTRQYNLLENLTADYNQQGNWKTEPFWGGAPAVFAVAAIHELGRLGQRECDPEDTPGSPCSAATHHNAQQLHTILKINNNQTSAGKPIQIDYPTCDITTQIRAMWKLGRTVFAAFGYRLLDIAESPNPENTFADLLHTPLELPNGEGGYYTITPGHETTPPVTANPNTGALLLYNTKTGTITPAH